MIGPRRKTENKKSIKKHSTISSTMTIPLERTAAISYGPNSHHQTGNKYMAFDSSKPQEDT